MTRTIDRAGSIRRLPSGRWQARATTPEGTRQSIGSFETERDANTALTLYLADMHRGTAHDPAKSRVTVKAFLIDWLAHRSDLRTSTLRSYETHVRVHILPVLGSVRLCDLDGPMVRRWAATIRSASSRHIAVRLLRSACTLAVNDGIIPRNPCTGKNPEPRSEERYAANLTELHDLIEAARQEAPILALQIELAAFAQLRAGEVLGLNCGDWNPDTLILEIRRQLTIDGLCPPKSRASIRDIEVPGFTADSINTHLSSLPATGTHDPVFPSTLSRTGRHTVRPVDTPAWRRAVASVPTLPGDFRFHDLRHSGITLVAEVPGVTLPTIMARLGHSRSDMASRYLHATKPNRRLAADGLNQAIASVYQA